MSIIRSPWLIGALASTAVLSGCVVAPVGQPYYSDPYGNVADTVTYAPIYAPVAPPAPYVETIPVAPYSGAIWINGYWNWSGNRHVWVPGRYERPRPGYHWEPRRWDRGPRGDWRLHGGGWRR